MSATDLQIGRIDLVDVAPYDGAKGVTGASLSPRFPFQIRKPLGLRLRVLAGKRAGSPGGSALAGILLLNLGA